MSDKGNVVRKSSPDNNVQKAYLRKSSAVVTMAGTSTEGSPAAPIVKSTFSDEVDSGAFQPWGDSNDYPKVSRIKIENSSTAFPLIMKKVGMMFGKGLVYFKEKKTANGIEYEFPDDEKINSFLFQNDCNYLMMERMMDYILLNNVFAEYIKNSTNSEIIIISHLEAEFSRFGGVSDEKNVSKLLYKGDWEDSTSAEQIDFVLKRYKYDRAHLEKYKKKFALHSCFPSPGRTLYARSPLHGILKTKGWLDYANSVPEIMSVINENAMNIKYHIQIPETYWTSINKDWEKLDQATREKYIDDKLTEMDNFLSGSANALKSFITHFAIDKLTGKKLVGWEITVLDDKQKKDAFITSLQEADTQISRSIGMDTSLSGIQPAGGKMGAGSGSDKRVGFQNTIAMSYADALIITEPLRIVQNYNGWDPEIKFGFLYDQPTTLNENPEGVETKI